MKIPTNSSNRKYKLTNDFFLIIIRPAEVRPEKSPLPQLKSSYPNRLTAIFFA
jgi:hypothetical protein